MSAQGDDGIAALGAESSFGGRSNLRTWLTGILKHKIIDTIRRQSRETVISGDAEGNDSEFDRLFEANGHWVEHPAAWTDPDAALTQQQFYKVLEECLKKLPKKTAQVFMMREHMGLETDEICKELGVTPTHLWVLIYRARMALRDVQRGAVLDRARQAGDDRLVDLELVDRQPAQERDARDAGAEVVDAQPDARDEIGRAHV